MEDRFIIRSVVFMAILAVLCQLTEQRHRCLSPTDCGVNALDSGDTHPRSFNSKFLSAVEDPSAIKQLMEKLLLQHNEFAEANGIQTEEEQDSTERPPTGADFMGELKPENAVIKVEEKSTERPPIASSYEDSGEEDENSSIEEHPTDTKVEEENSTEGPPIESSFADILSQLKPENNNETKKDDESIFEVTTVEPQQLASPLDFYEYHFETTTIQPERIIEPIQQDNSAGQVDTTTQTPVNYTKKKNTSSYFVNIPPINFNNKNTKPTTTKRPHVILAPQKLDSFTERPSPPGNQDKITRKPTTKPDKKINSLMPVDQDQDIRGEIQLETLNRPISTRKPLPTTGTPVVGSEAATSSRPNKKPINIIPESIVKKGQKPAAPTPTPATATGISKPQGSGIRNPTRNPVAAPVSEPDDYLISALASIADSEENEEDEDGDDEDDEADVEVEEETEEEEESTDENGGAEEEDEYIFTDSAEENEERENFDYIDSNDASDVISRVMEEVDALI